jgi:hypothetical protein
MTLTAWRIRDPLLRGTSMKNTRLALVVLSVLPSLTWAASPITYSASGAPDLSQFAVGKSTYADVAAVLGKPVMVGTDEHGTVTGASFYVPIQGDSTSTNAVTNAATGAAKSTLMSKVSLGMGSVLQHIPGVAGMAASHVADTASTQAGTVLVGPRQIWNCGLSFSHGGLYDHGTCGLTNKPVGP